MTVEAGGLVGTDAGAVILGVTPETLRRYCWVHADFPVVRVGRTLQFDPEALRAWRVVHPPRRARERGGGGHDGAGWTR